MKSMYNNTLASTQPTVIIYSYIPIDYYWRPLANCQIIGWQKDLPSKIREGLIMILLFWVFQFFQWHWCKLIVHTHRDFVNQLQKWNGHHGTPSSSPVMNTNGIVLTNRNIHNSRQVLHFSKNVHPHIIQIQWTIHAHLFCQEMRE